MKQNLLIITLLIICLLPVMLAAQDNENSKQIVKKEIIIKGDPDLAQLEQLKKMNVDINLNTMKEEAADAPFFGIYPSDLDFPKAQALNYSNNYGVLITGVVPNSPAYEYRLAEDDIIMEIDGKKALNLKEFDKLKALYRAGDKANLKIYRNNEIININFVFGSKVKTEQQAPNEQPRQKKLSVGFGGGSWTPMYIDTDNKDVNDLVSALGFTSFPDTGLPCILGFAGKGHIGKGWFIGGQFLSYEQNKKVQDSAVPNYINIMKYDMSEWGITLDKRFALSKNVITSLGLMIGSASHEISLVHTNGDINWSNVQDNNYSVTFSRSYLAVQPRAELMIRILPWLGFRGEVGYLYGYAPNKGWKASYSDTEIYEVHNSPDTPLQGLTISAGPWFGF